ncbi:hypothetical protein DFH06DRAFT_1204464 [Mycena polygramma]|nr:hypothetical protein DFH06DRAFT_1204464 [Mycena polygramma]
MSVLRQDRDRLADLQAQITNLERSLRALRAENALVQARLDSFTYPVLTLPSEIMLEIFVHFLPPRPLCPSLRGTESPIFLASICRKWREIALSTPTLWRAIPITLHATDTAFQRQHCMLEEWLERSRSGPLSIRIQSSWRSRPRPGQPLILKVPSFGHRTRWEHLTLFLVDPDLVISDDPMPLLSHLDVYLDTRKAFTLPLAPRLRTVTLNATAASSLTLPWVQLTSVTLRGIHPTDCTPILQQTLNVVHCELRLIQGFGGGSDHPDLVLPSLKSLALFKESYHLPKSAVGYLNSFIVPALLSLRIPERFLRTTSSGPVDSLASFISKSGCSLQQVHITGSKNVSEKSYLEAFPSIPQFSFENSYIGSDEDESDIHE